MKYTGYIYKIVNDINNKVYIGQTTRNIEERWKEHVQNIKYKKYHLYLAMNKYGVENFNVEFLDKAKSNTFDDLLIDLDIKEKHWIGYYNSFNDGYNETSGGRNARLLYDTKSKQICQYTIDGELLAIYKSISQASNISKVKEGNIRKCCLKRGYTGGGYIWRYISDPVFDNELECIKQRTTLGKRISVCQYNLNGELLNIYESLSDAGKETNTSFKHISKCCKGERKTVGGFIWRYEGDILTNTDIVNANKILNDSLKKKVIKYDISGNYISEYNSIQEASKLNNIHHSNIIACCKHKTKTSGGYIWKYAE